MKGKREISYSDKVKFIKGLLAGDVDLSIYKPPTTYQVRSFEGVYTLSTNEGSINMNKEQYDYWLTTLGEQDKVFHIQIISCDGCEPLEDGSDGVTRPLVWNEQRTYSEEREEIKNPAESITREIAPVIVSEAPTEPEVQLFAIPVKRTGGKLSEYGETWRAIDLNFGYDN